MYTTKSLDDTSSESPYLPQPNTEFDATLAHLSFPATHLQQPLFPNPAHIHPGTRYLKALQPSLASKGTLAWPRHCRLSSPCRSLPPYLPQHCRTSKIAWQPLFPITSRGLLLPPHAGRLPSPARHRDAFGVSSSSLMGWAG